MIPAASQRIEKPGVLTRAAGSTPVWLPWPQAGVRGLFDPCIAACSERSPHAPDLLPNALPFAPPMHNLIKCLMNFWHQETILSHRMPQNLTTDCIVCKSSLLFYFFSSLCWINHLIAAWMYKPSVCGISSYIDIYIWCWDHEIHHIMDTICNLVMLSTRTIMRRWRVPEELLILHALNPTRLEDSSCSGLEQTITALHL